MKIFFIMCFMSFCLSASATSSSKTYKSFEMVEMQLNGKKFKAYIADTVNKRSLGLMHIHKLPADEGVLFVFSESARLSFWMKNTYIPLTIGFFDEEGRLLETLDMEPVRSVAQVEFPSYTSAKKALLALEMNKGWFAKHQIKVGERLHFIQLPTAPMLKSRIHAGRLSRSMNP